MFQQRKSKNKIILVSWNRSKKIEVWACYAVCWFNSDSTNFWFELLVGNCRVYPWANRQSLRLSSFIVHFDQMKSTSTSMQTLKFWIWNSNYEIRKKSNSCCRFGECSWIAANCFEERSLASLHTFLPISSTQTWNTWNSLKFEKKFNQNTENFVNHRVFSQ